MMKLLLSGVLLLGSVALANATIVDSGMITIGGASVGTFVDQTTGKRWLDLDAFYGWNSGPLSHESFNSWEGKLAGSGFHIATATDMAELVASAPADPATWLSDATAMGAASTPRQLIWGIYNNGSGTVAGWIWKFSYNAGWGSMDFGRDKNSEVGSINSLPEDKDLGIWTVSDSGSNPVPEPSTFLLLSAGIAGVSLMRRRKNNG